MDLSAIIAQFYARNGYVELNNGKTGSITFLGAVSPAGGNLKEPVTESTKKAARCFYALEQARADSKRYPAVDPIESYSKYIEYPELIEYLDKYVQKDWAKGVQFLKDILLRGKEAKDQINILGDDGVPLEYHVAYNKSEVVDFAILQQDSFDKVDGTTPMPRQKHLTNIVLDVCRNNYSFDDFEDVSKFFRKTINLINQMKYSQFESQEFFASEKELKEFLATKKVASNQKESA